MSRIRPVFSVLGALACAGLACGGAAGTSPPPSAESQSAPTSASTPWPVANEFGVRYCL